MSRFSNYIVYLDQYGDTQFDNANAADSVFMQNFCIFDKRHYGEIIVPKLQALKFRHYGHDGVFLRADDIHGLNHQQQFINELNEIIEHINFVLISCVVDKAKLEKKDAAIFMEVLNFGLDHSHRFLQEREQTDLLTYVIVASCGEENDENTLQLFRQVCAQADGDDLNFELHFTGCDNRPLGMQFASLLAIPILQHFRDPESDNPLFENLKDKFYCKGGRKKAGEGYEGWGLKNFT